MTNSKHAKCALLASILSVVVCVAMLVGSTFAWFTDSVTSGNNKIMAGNLNIDLSIRDEAGNYTSVKGSKAPLFNYDKWEPGYTAYTNVKVSTTGNLALKYTMRVTMLDEISILADVIDVYYAAAEILPNNDRTLPGLTKIGTLRDVLEGKADTVLSDTLIPGENAADFATIVLKMQETAGNEYQGLSIGAFDLKIIAVQYTHEKDSFDNQYDKNAEFSAIYKVTPENIEEYLSGQHGSISDTKLILAPGNYGKLEIGTITANSKDDTTYICPNGNSHAGKSLTFTNIDEFKAHFKPGEWHSSSTYIRTIENLTIAAEDGAVVEGLSIVSGHMYSIKDPINPAQGGYYLTHKLHHINFVNISFTGKVDINTSHSDTAINGITFDRCSFTTNGTASSNGAALRYYNEANNGKVKNLIVKNSTFKNCYQGVYTSQINGISITGCTFDTTGHNAIAIQSQSVTDHKAVVIENNSFKNIKDRIIRFNGVGADTQITIKNNTATDSGDEAGQVIKATSLADGIIYNISGNNWGAGTSVANPEFADGTANIKSFA